MRVYCHNLRRKYTYYIKAEMPSNDEVEKDLERDIAWFVAWDEYNSINEEFREREKEEGEIDD